MSDEIRDEEEHIPESGFFLPSVSSFHDCDHNFKSLSEAVGVVIGEIRSNALHTQESMKEIVTQVNANMKTVSSDLNKILSSQVMMICLVVITISLALVSLKSFVDIFLSIYHNGM